MHPNQIFEIFHSTQWSWGFRNGGDGRLSQTVKIESGKKQTCGTNWSGIDRVGELSIGGNGSTRLKLEPGMFFCQAFKEKSKGKLKIFCLGSRAGLINEWVP